MNLNFDGDTLLREWWKTVKANFQEVLNHKTATTLDHPDGSVTSSKIASDAVTQSKIADGAVTTSKLADYGITANKLAQYAVTSAKIYPGAVLTAHVKDGTITMAKLSPDVKTALSNAGGDQSGTWVTYDDLTLAGVNGGSGTANDDIDFGAYGVAGNSGLPVSGTCGTLLIFPTYYGVLQLYFPTNKSNNETQLTSDNFWVRSANYQYSGAGEDNRTLKFTSWKQFNSTMSVYNLSDLTSITFTSGYELPSTVNLYEPFIIHNDTNYTISEFYANDDVSDVLSSPISAKGTYLCIRTSEAYSDVDSRSDGEVLVIPFGVQIPDWKVTNSISAGANGNLNSYMDFGSYGICITNQDSNFPEIGSGNLFVLPAYDGIIQIFTPYGVDNEYGIPNNRFYIRTLYGTNGTVSPDCDWVKFSAEREYSTTPQRIGTWIDGTPIWRVAFDIDVEYDEMVDGFDALTICGVLKDGMAPASATSVICSDVKVRINTPCYIDDISTTQNGNIWSPDKELRAQAGYGGIYGWIEFMTSADNLK